MTKNITKPFQAEFMKNPPKGKITTEPIEAKPFSVFYKLQNESYLKNQNYKTNSLTKTHSFYALFTFRIHREFADSAAKSSSLFEKACPEQHEWKGQEGDFLYSLFWSDFSR